MMLSDTLSDHDMLNYGEYSKYHLFICYFSKTNRFKPVTLSNLDQPN